MGDTHSFNIQYEDLSDIRRYCENLGEEVQG